ncbi:MAG: tannase/feruloyl esterase family alpha/beta hydrolase, partial [Deltaproteobacteria bacterium]|nr:tannase/feruloyl esterase family alpha/beta hydrolase [Deltaproteobacteria bacterium]
SPRWLWFDLFLNTRILPNQRGFFNFYDLNISFNSGFRDPDLSKFKEKGGKMILYHGWADSIVTPWLTVDYYETVVKKMGGLEQTQEFFRLFMVPGMDHCSILPGKGPDKFDVLTALENWVEKGVAPAHIIASKLAKEGKVVCTRPLCVYPKVAKYKGTGSPDDAANFTCVGQ